MNKKTADKSGDQVHVDIRVNGKLTATIAFGEFSGHPLSGQWTGDTAVVESLLTKALLASALITAHLSIDYFLDDLVKLVAEMAEEELPMSNYPF